jgi:hypothetical protein
MRSLPILVLLLSGAALAQTADAVKEGLWEISIRSDMAGQSVTQAPIVVRQCITQTTARELMNQLAGATGSCQVSNLTQSGATSRWNMSCTGQVEVTGTGELTMQSDGFNGGMSLLVTMGGQTVPLNQSFEAHWTGPCK